MIDEAKQDLATRYVLGELGSGEALNFHAELAENAELLQFVSELQETFAEVALAAAPERPREELLTNILHRIRGEAPQGSFAGKPDVESKVIRFKWLPWALAACLAVACTLLFVERDKLRGEVITLRERDALSQMRIATLNAQTEAYAKVLAVVVWDEEKQRGIVKLDQLPQPAADRDYQLWMISPDRAAPISAGVVPIGENQLTQAAFKPTQTVHAVSKFAVSLERKGGAPAPEGPIILIGN